MFQFTQVAICKGSVADNIDYNDPSVVRKSIHGDLQVLMQKTTGMLLLKMKDFEYGVNPNDQILYDDKDPNFKLMMCLDANPQFAWILKINDKPELVYYIINQRCRLIHKRASRMILDDIQNQFRDLPNYPKLEEPQRYRYNPQTNKKQQISNESSLVEASKTFGHGLAMVGNYISRGLLALGGFLSKRVQPSTNINVSPETKNMIDKSVGASKNLLEFSTQKVAGLFRIALNEALKLEGAFQKTEQGKKLKQNGTIDSAKNNLKLGLEAITHVYDGYARGYEQASNGLSQGANQVVSAKYGNEAGNAALQLAQGYKNVNKIPNVINEALKKVLKQTANQHVRKN